MVYDSDEDVDVSDPKVPERTGGADATIGRRSAADVSSSMSLNERGGSSNPNAGIGGLRKAGELVEGSSPRGSIDDSSTLAGSYSLSEPDLLETADFISPLGEMPGAGESSRGQGRAHGTVPSSTSGNRMTRAGTPRTWDERDVSRPGSNEPDDPPSGAKGDAQAPKGPALGRR